MNDTAPKIALLIARRHAEMSPEERMKIPSDMFDTARKIGLIASEYAVAPRS
jgi:hypothetical protein